MGVLFRTEAVVHATRRLSGVVVLATPLSVRFLGLVLGAIIVAGVVFVSVATYARKATVIGWLVPDRGMIRASTSSGGFIQELLVKEGDAVEKGQPLAQIRVAAETATGNVGEMVLTQLRAELEAQRKRGQAQIERLSAESAQASLRLANMRAELTHLRTQADLQAQRLQLARADVARAEELGARGNLARNEVERRQSVALGVEQDLAGLRRQIGALEREISDTSARIATIPIEQETIRAESASAAASLEQRSIDAEARRLQVVLSPVAGRVAALPVTVGQPIALAATVAVIVPEGARIEAELLAPSRGAGFIRPGQEVQLMLQAFPHQRFGTVRGAVRSISRTVLGPTEIAIPGLSIQEPVFRVRVTLAREEIDAYGEAIPLQPGMLLSADVVFDRRSLIQWLFDPLYAVARRS